MEAYLLEHQDQIRITLLLGALLFVALWESFAPTRTLLTNTAVRWIYNIGLLAIDNILMRLVYPVVSVGLSVILAKQGWGLFNWLELPPVIAVAATLVLLDGSSYLQHWLLHKIPLLWQLHKVHHSDIDYDCTTGFRFHPLESVFTVGLQLMVIAALGAPPVAVVCYEIVFIFTAILNHGNISLPHRLDRYLRVVLVTPDMHRVHHSVNPREGNSNFAGVLSIWDRLFGTYCAQPAGGQQGMTIGLREYRDPQQLHLHSLLLLPFRGKREVQAAGLDPVDEAPARSGDWET